MRNTIVPKYWRRAAWLGIVSWLAVGLHGPDAAGAVRPAAIFGDNMVLQRDLEVPVWGWADKGEKVTVEIQGMTKTVETDEKGKWMVKVGPFKAGGPCDLKIAGSNAVAIKNVMFGDVWICSGQSNMQWGLKEMSDAATEIPQANYPNMRLITLYGTSMTPMEDLAKGYLPSQWVGCSPETAGTFSAVSYYFGRELSKALNVPIGLIAMAEGASPIRSWISPKLQNANPLFKELFEDYRTYAERSAAYAAKRKTYEEEAKKAKEEGKPPPPFPGFFEAYGEGPGILYNARIHPLAPFGLKGIVWYQGENDAIYKHTRPYHDYFALMIQDWRDLWPQGDIPFLFVQLPWLTTPVNEPVEWAEIRDAQRRTLTVKNTGMAMTTDICEPELHPRKKSELGKRLSLLARSIAYGEKLVCSGPLLDRVEFKDGKAVVSFTEIGGGLVVKGEKLQGFSLAGPDKAFVKAEAEIQGNQVLISSDKVPDPKAVRYAWTDNPVGTLYNPEGFPTACFRTDDW